MEATGPSNLSSSFTVYEYLKCNSASRPTAPAILAPGKTSINYSDLVEQVERVRGQLARAGVGRGSNVGMVIQSRDAMAATLLAVGSCATAVPFTPTEDPAIDSIALERFQVSAMLVETDDESGPYAPYVPPSIPVIGIKVSETQAGRFDLLDPPETHDRQPEAPEPCDPIILVQTTGTTGDPKVAPVTHSTQIACYQRVVDEIYFSADDRSIVALPLDHIAGVNEVFRTAMAGASQFVTEFNASEFVDQVIEYEVTWVLIVPSMFRAILTDAISKKAELAKSKLRLLRTGTAPLGDRLQADVETAFGVPLIQSYAATEALMIAIDPGPGRRKRNAIGLVDRDVVRVCDPDGHELSPGLTGEVCARGPVVFPGYLNDPEATKAAFRGEWFRTGDLGQLDEDGYLSLVGRVKETINRGGETIAPGEIEMVLAGLDGVEECAVFAVPHSALGEEVWAAVKLAPNSEADPKSIRLQLGRVLPFAKTPKRILTLDEIPRNRLGKVDYDKLRQRYGNERDLSA